MNSRTNRDYDDNEPRPRRRKVTKKKSAGPIIVAVAVVAGVFLLCSASIVAYLLLRDKSASAHPPYDPFPNMMAHWSFDDVQGEMGIVDRTGRGNNGVLTGGRLAPGVRGNALWLDGRADQYCELAQGKELNFEEGTEFTIAAWYQTKERVGTILAFRNSQRPTQLELYIRNNQLLCIVGDDTDTSDEHAFVRCDVENDGKWHHAAFTRRNRNIELFYDGVSAGVTGKSGSGGKITSDVRKIGCNLNFNDDEKRKIGRVGFKGGIDEVYIFARALQPNEIQALMRR
jgi:Concanavalin A-like lectin/glucanases superfamily